MRYAKLRVKIKSLAAEASIIRKEERRCKTSRNYRKTARRELALGKRTSPGMNVTRVPLTNSEAEARTKAMISPSPEQLAIYEDLHSHRVGVVRQEARAAQLALAYLRGISYVRVEGNRRGTGPLGRKENRVPLHLIASNAYRFGDLQKEGYRLEDVTAFLKDWVEAPVEKMQPSLVSYAKETVYRDVTTGHGLLNVN